MIKKKEKHKLLTKKNERGDITTDSVNLTKDMKDVYNENYKKLLGKVRHKSMERYTLLVNQKTEYGKKSSSLSLPIDSIQSWLKF